MTANNWETNLFQDFIQCPHCGDVDEEYCEYPRDLQHDGDEVQTECSTCGRQFDVTLSVSCSYNTEPCKS